MVLVSRMARKAVMLEAAETGNAGSSPSTGATEKIST